MQPESGRYQLEKAVAVEAVREAAQLCRRVQKGRVLGAALVKGDRSPVTIADFGAQAIVSRRLAQRFASDPVMGEESAAELVAPERASIRDAVCAEVAASIPGAKASDVLAWIGRAQSDGGRGRFWALDPIDGTKGFLRGEQYAVALALLEDGVVQVGALACPSLPWQGASGCVLVAVRGRGAEVLPLEAGEGSPVRVSAIASPRDARLLESVEAAHGDHAGGDRLKERLDVRAPGVRLDSQAKYAVLARGDAEVYLRLPSSEEYRENLWDHAAGAIVVEEAGGRVSDVEGRPLDFTAGRKLNHNRGVIATNGRLHDAFLGALRELRGAAK